ncbi:MAG: carbohydrate kinase family protein [Armatimonadetes bacterium]|nr:carbohydrate kinase family protein [Armatimonadota bacterium]
MADVACLGILVADVVGKPIEGIPERGKLQFVEQMELHAGGCASNTALALGKIGIGATLLGKVGDDGFGDFLIHEAEKCGVGTEGLKRERSAHTSSTMVMVAPDGERTFLHYVGVNATLKEEDLRFDLIRDAKVFAALGCFLMPGFDGEPMARVLKRVQEETEATVVLDTAWDPTGRWMGLLAPTLPHVDVFLPSYEEAVQLSGREQPEEIAAAFFEYGVGVVGVKLGEKGAYVQRRGEPGFTVPGFRVNAVDALGAGDCFVAGFVTGLVKGWDLERTARFACATGATCVTALGATTGIKPLDEIESFAARAKTAS